jgi:hypothetical protein
MFAIIAAILFGLALIFDVANADIGIGVSVLVTAGLLCMAVHMIGIGAGWRPRAGRLSRWSSRRR